MPNKIAPGTETKKEMIAKLLLDNNNKYSAREIARIVRTTEGNVFKEKSKLKTTGALSDKDVAILSQSNETDTLTLSHTEAKTSITLREYRSLTDIPPMNQDDIKKLYSAFKDVAAPVEIIAQSGFDPRLVELEFGRFQRLKGLVLTPLVREVIDRYGISNDEVASRIILNATQNGTPSNYDILTLIDAVASRAKLQAEASTVSKLRQGFSTGPLKSYPCENCGEPIEGAVFDEETDIGKNVRNVRSLFLHRRCGGVFPDSDET